MLAFRLRQHQCDIGHLERRRDSSLIILRPCLGMHVAAQDSALAIIDRLGNAALLCV